MCVCVCVCVCVRACVRAYVCLTPVITASDCIKGQSLYNAWVAKLGSPKDSPESRGDSNPYSL